MTNSHTTLGACAALALIFALSACGGDKGKGGAAQSPAPQTAAAAESPAPPADPAHLDAEIARLEKQAERNPADDSARSDLAKAYVRRGDSHRAANQLQEALVDYQRALRADPDNEQAQRAAAEISPDVEGERTDENGAPAPLPITPNVADEEGKPTQTPKKP
ncbi:MAG TPA: tetratricopeptide repeat protein [Pyrinomonadaceae bacterium]|jgi:Flp pilus assembly protein TadD|nr:tetratricopeptide repeat protein [Pyrinomonadaceae bacterium]